MYVGISESPKGNSLSDTLKNINKPRYYLLKAPYTAFLPTTIP